MPSSLAVNKGSATPSAQGRMTDAEQITRQFKRAPTKQVAELLEALATPKQAQQLEPDRFAA
jgi:conjugal transfer/entry exclusion protein